MGLSLAYNAKIGTFDPSKEPHTHREFYFAPVNVNQANAKQVQQDYVFGIPNYDWKDF